MYKTKKEKWVDVKGYEGRYTVSNHGRVMSLITGRILKPGTGFNGYAKVQLSKNGKSKTLRVHRLVAEHFVTNRSTSNDIVMHRNKNILDNAAWNLKWTNAKGLSKHRTPSKPGKRLTEGQVRKIRSFLETTSLSMVDIAKRMRISYGSVMNAARYKTYSYIDPKAKRTYAINRLKGKQRKAWVSTKIRGVMYAG